MRRERPIVDQRPGTLPDIRTAAGNTFPRIRLLHMMFDCRPSPQEHSRRHGAQTVVPHAKRVHGHIEEIGELSL
jgi:hypothetical protein